MSDLRQEYDALLAELESLEPSQQTDGLLSEYQQLQQELSSLPMTKDEFIDKREEDKAKSITQTVAEFGAGAVEGAGMIVGQGKDAVQELFEKGFEFDGLKGIGYVGGKDFVRFAKSLGEAAMDKTYSEEEEVDREYKRYRQNFDYNTKVRPAMLASDEIEYKKITDFGANFVDPFMAFPVAKLGSLAVRAPLVAAQKAATAGAKATKSKGLVNLAKFSKGTANVIRGIDRSVDIVGKVGAYPSEMAARVGAKVVRKGIKGGALLTGLGLKGTSLAGSGLAKVSALPRRGVAKVAEKLTGLTQGLPVAAAFGGQVTGAVAGIPGFREFLLTETIGTIAKKVGREAGEILTTLGKPANNQRFLYRLSTNAKVSEKTRDLATLAYRFNGTALGDGAFNLLANGLSIGAINAGLSGLAGEDARTSGAAFGSGVVAGGVMPFGQKGMTAGKSDFARNSRSIRQHMKNKLDVQQSKKFLNLPRETQVFLATAQESGIGAPKIMIMEPNAYLEMLNAERAERGEELLKRAPGGHFSQITKTVFINEKNLQKSAKEATEIAAHEMGHAILYESLGSDPLLLQLLLEEYKTNTNDPKGEAFYFKFDKDGVGQGEPIYINQKGVEIARQYDSKQRGIGIGRNAEKLAQEIGADNFAMMFSEDPNVFNTFHPRLRNSLINVSRKLLGAVGRIDPITGNSLSNPVSKAIAKIPAIERIFRNYSEARIFEANEKSSLSEKGVRIEPKTGQTGEARFVELFGGNGLNLRDAKNFVIPNKGLLRELIRIRDDYKNDPRDTWRVSKKGLLEGTQLLPELRNIFTRNDPFGNVAVIIDGLQQAINERFAIGFGYRSGTKGNYQNPFDFRDIAIYGFGVSPMQISRRKRKDGRVIESRPSLKVLGYNQAVIRQNVDALVKRGIIKDPQKFMRQLSEQGQKALADPEGRINPEGRKENEIMTVVFGLKESAGEISSGRLREALESNFIKKSFVSFDVEAMAGLTKLRDDAFGFKYDNIRDNYNPYRQSGETFKPVDSNSAVIPDNQSDPNLFSPTEEADQQFQISTRNPTATNRRQDPVAENLVITLDDILNEPGFAESYANAVKRYPGVKASQAKPEKVISNFVNMVVDNLLHLYDSVDPKIRDRSKLWYVGARKIALDFATKYNISQQAVAATMAATSPQTDWYKNVDRTRRILETVINEQETVFDNDMVNHHIKIASGKDKAAQTALAKSYSGKKFKELNNIGQAAFIRTFDELYRSRDYQIISPEGEFLGAAKKENGENEMYSWLSYNQITKALSAISDDSKANISNTMGEAHKIRNFYNNILLPFVDTNAVTIDTHAVAAALLRPLASKDVEVGNMLGAKAKGKRAASIKNSKIAGISGLYGVYAEAYRKAAKARGVLPREMQSITWEAIRGLYPKEIKQPKFKEQINDLFKLYENGKITINELRAKVFEKAGGIDPPTWFGPGNTSGKDRSGSGFYPQGRRPPVDERQLFSPSVRGLGARDRSRGVRATSPGITTNGLDRFMIPAAARAAAIDADLEKFRN